MRRSIRDAFVGLSIIGGLVGLGGTMLWLRGVSLNANTWDITASFKNASGLAQRSPVTYRGILIGSVGKIVITPKAVNATLKINDGQLRLAKPVVAKVITSSILGGDVQVALISKGENLPRNSPSPRSEKCLSSKVLCQGDEIKGQSLSSISSLTEELERMLQDADKQDVVSNLVDSTKQFDQTQKNLDELIIQVKSEISRAGPIINNLYEASDHIKNILAALDNPNTLNDIQKTASSTRALTEKMNSLGSDMDKIIKDEELMSAVRSVTIGLGELFNELYPHTDGSNNR